MEINQSNIFGDNNIIVKKDNKELTDDIKEKILNYLKRLKVDSVSLQFDYSQEMQEFIDEITLFLRHYNYVVYGDKDRRIASGIQKGELSILKHPSVSNFAIIRIGD
jgi:hypothetical protein